ncbi:flagellar motor switch/type III secretory pathway protein [Pseudomonas sp. C1C7]|uniref:FliM/FliN family flagellar motor switch protein n=1 Tax=Pseudomonas sp. C1C7 TaxID=2735272 RepID=UPI001585FA4D|nr:FliM/FliN family flagellar motor switch protein [Pseudomonas sp. C1C7]NUT77296.1 flagellar motor switch/type III secretory pathway protein [Pseudomonas sp. C1C7]
MSLLKLRRINLQAHAVSQAVQRWRYAGVDAGSSVPPGQSGYLRFCVSGEGGEWQGLIDARDWLHQSLPGLQSLLIVECSLTTIAELFRAVSQPLLMDVDDLQYREIYDVESIAPHQLPTQEMPWLDTAQGRVWITRLPPARATGPAHEDNGWLSDLPFRLDLKLGFSHLHHTHAIRLKTGDVLRIAQRAQRCCLGDRCLGFFSFTEQGIHMQSSDTDPQDAPEPDLDPGALPVKLEFVLATHDIDLARLSQIASGQLIPLADDAAQRIEVRANGKPVARGELVQLDEQLGVELLEVYRNPRDE